MKVTEHTGGAEKCRSVKTAGEGAVRTTALKAAERPTTIPLEEARTAAIRKAENISRINRLSVSGRRSKGNREKKHQRHQSGEDDNPADGKI